ncbi:uncharacterized protein TRIADDRAFT_61764 [Trichoplax adhaerens]|uniref:Adipose-secreted signaling protein n=1 Tax=Trichoplax adhaerens TaxID=10228 RepID=B3SBW9_TRIAD|nr:hypothetical protein TRIADDRAFT_61764 [Trichoplax adhaerens]EDV19747.1 hypothetical protein TRIADDRAFT_61764 [Trichoplax adhaerens]|eukprot:XP_002117771.1 hypothetical protein TRIADDRAFT_61764 [Trichoplax adhaerens]
MAEDEDILGEHVVIPPMQNIYIKVSHIVYNAAKKCYTIGAELAVIKEGLFREHFIIYKGEKISRSDNVSKLLDNEYLTVIIKAQIMGKGRGTPSLKDGVHKIGVIESDNDSDSSDWKGFD